MMKHQETAGRAEPVTDTVIPEGSAPPTEPMTLAFLEQILAIAGPGTVLVVCVENWAIRPRYKATFLPADVTRVQALKEAVQEALVQVAGRHP